MSCLICEIHEADKTGSHIIPYFILESNLNEADVKGRDKGIGFRLGETSSDFKFGRSLTSDALARLLGRPATDEEIDESIREQLHVEDHIFCTTCETRLSHIESLYKSEVDKSIREGKELSADQVKLLQFFWLTVIFRCSVAKYSTFKLKPELEVKVRAVVNHILADSPNETKKNCLGSVFPFKLQAFVNMTTHDKTRNAILPHPAYANPYLLFINEYILLFEFSDESQIEELGVALKIDVSERTLGLTYINNPAWENVISYCMTIKAKQFYRANVERFRRAYSERHSAQAPDSITEMYMNELITDDATIDEATKYSDIRIKALTKKYIK